MSINPLQIVTVLTEALRHIGDIPGDVADEIPAEYAEEIIVAGKQVAVQTASGWAFGVVFLTWPEFEKAEVNYYDPDYPRHWVRETFTIDQIVLWSTFASEGIASL